MVYQLCCHLNIKTHENSDINEMSNNIKLYFNKSIQDIYKEIATKLSTYSLNELNKLNTQLIKHKKIKQKLETINESKLLARTLLTNEECIVYAAKYYWYDISESLYPYDELMHIHYCKENEKCYKPLDKSFFDNYTKNKYYYQLDYFWKPVYKDFYSSKCISNLLKHECIELSESELKIEYLNNIINNNNFYIGVFPSKHPSSTYIYKTELNFNDILISYGTYDNTIVVSIEELNDFFKNHCEFMDLLECKSKIDKRLVEKIKRFCKQNPLEEKCNSLLTTINNIYHNNNIIDDTIRSLESVYKIENDKIDLFLNSIFEISMYMRGWKVNNNEALPLNKTICNENSFYMDQIEENINTKIKELFEFIEKSEQHIKNTIIKLPFIKINENDKTFYRNTNPDEGLTLIERFKIIMNNDSVYSCIRMSSNFIASSYYYYNTVVLKNPKKFNIEEIDFIQ